jgi:hypothetical protein
MATPNGATLQLPSATTLAGVIDDSGTPLRHKRFVAGAAGDVAEARIRPWWAIEAAERALMASGMRVMWRRASASDVGHRIYDVALQRTRTKDDLAAIRMSHVAVHCECNTGMG